MVDKNTGIVRARTFSPDWGIPEDEANGSGAMKLAMVLKGSVIYANPIAAGLIELGGQVKAI